MSDREKILVYISGGLFVFLLFWYLLLFPSIKSIEKITADLTTAQNKLKQLGPVSLTTAETAVKLDFELKPREEQLSSLVDFFDKKIKYFGMEFISLSQKPAELPNVLDVDLKFRASYYQFLGFLNALPELNTVLVINSVEIAEKENRLEVEIKMVSGYL